MNGKRLILASALILIVLLSGCLELPLDQQQPIESSTEYEFKGDKSVKQIMVMEGTPVENASEWEGDCSEKMKNGINDFIDMMKSLEQSGMADEGSEGGIEALENIRDAISCEFIVANGQGVLKIGLQYSPEDIEYFNNLPGAEGQIGYTENEDGSVEYIIPGSAGGSMGLPSGGLKEVKVRVEGDLISLEPSGYVEEAGYYVYKNPSSQLTEDLKINYIPVEPGFDLGMLFIPLVVFIGLVLLIGVGVIVYGSMVQKKKEEKGEAGEGNVQGEEEGVSTEEDNYNSTSKIDVGLGFITGNGKGNAEEEEDNFEDEKIVDKPVEEKFAELPKKKFRKPPEFMAQGNEQGEQVELPHLSMEEADMAEGLVDKLYSVKGDFKPADVKKQVLDAGFSERVADEVVKRLYG